MKHCSAFVLYNSKTNQLYRIRATRKHDNSFSFDLLNYKIRTNPSPYKYGSIQSMLKAVLSLLKENNLVPYSYEAFGTTWYDISFIDIETLDIERYGLRKEEK